MKIGTPPSWTAKILRISVMDRYIFSELILPFLFGMGLFTSLGLSLGPLFDLVRKVTESGLFLNVAVQVLLLKIPGFIVFAFPMSILLATLMVYSRLSSDSELVALRSVGVNIYRLVIPAIILSLLVTGVTYVFNDFITPAANYQANLILDQALDKAKPFFRQSNIIYPEYTEINHPDGDRSRVLTRIFYAEEFDGEKMQALTILDRSQQGVNQILTSQSAIWNIAENTWDFFNGTIYLINPDGSYRNIVRFEHQKLDLPKPPLDLAKRGRDLGEMNIFQAQEYLQVIKLSADEKKIRKYQVRIQEKIALPFVCLVFGLIGSALGARPQNTGKATSFGICVVLVFSYYLLSFLTSSMGIWGVLSPFIAVWLPNFLGLTAGSLLLVQTARTR